MGNVNNEMKTEFADIFRYHFNPCIENMELSNIVRCFDCLSMVLYLRAVWISVDGIFHINESDKVLDDGFSIDWYFFRVAGKGVKQLIY